MPARASVTYSPFMFHRQKGIWGGDAEDFRPDRWLSDEANAGRRAGGFVPFSAGPRTVRSFMWYRGSLISDTSAIASVFR